ncbi:hypothetical protein MKEN_00701600 [Mycena kentingensis (nom. inval.)]|nr:hypothetical protein MKEN_00701600 [Mycena kentingensis (nom. inval.)]
MDPTKARLASFFDQGAYDDDASFSQKSVDDAKLSKYAAAPVRKSKREKEAEAEARKAKEEAASISQAYEEFIETFAGSGTKVSTFVKADSKAPAYATTARGHEGLRGRPRSPSPTSVPPRPRGKRAMDSFLEEIKRDQAQREAKYSRHGFSSRRSLVWIPTPFQLLAKGGPLQPWQVRLVPNTLSVAQSGTAYESQSGSRDRGDPETTNLFVANLPPNVSEPSLGMFFAKFGPIASVKIMWPRMDMSSGPGANMTQSRQLKNAGLSGFVSFMKRKDAEDAQREYDGFEWGGSILRVGWGRAVPIGTRAIYELPKTSESSRYRSRSRSRSPPEHHRSYNSHRSRSPRRSRSGSPRRRRSRSRDRRQADSRSPSPTDVLREEEEFVSDSFIRAVAAEIKGHGSKYEQNLKERERNNPKFAFLLRRDHRRHAFYRGLVESSRNLEPEFDDDGYNSVYSTDSGEESEREKTGKNALGKLARKRFESMLRGLSGKRGEMARCMAFSLEHAEAAPEVADLIITSLLVDGTPVPRKVARLHLICDILHNSAASVPSAWKFRQEFQPRLGVVFDHLANIYHSFPGRITADIFKKQITSVVDIWEDWIVFPPDFTTELRQRLDGVAAEGERKVEVVEEEVKEEVKAPSRFKTSTFKLATDDVDGEPLKVDDLDGQPIEDVDGEPLGDVDGEPLADVDGEPLADVDGEPMDEDLDGEPMGDVDGEPMVDDLDGVPVQL